MGKNTNVVRIVVVNVMGAHVSNDETLKMHEANDTKETNVMIKHKLPKYLEKVGTSFLSDLMESAIKKQIPERANHSKASTHTTIPVIFHKKQINIERYKMVGLLGTELH